MLVFSTYLLTHLAVYICFIPLFVILTFRLDFLRALLLSFGHIVQLMRVGKEKSLYRVFITILNTPYPGKKIIL